MFIMLKKLLSVFLCTAILLGNLAMVSFAEETEDIVEPVAESVTDVSHSDAEDQVSAESAEEYSVTWTNPFVSVSMELREDAVAVANIFKLSTRVAGNHHRSALLLHQVDNTLFKGKPCQGV